MTERNHEEWELKCFGCSTAQAREGIDQLVRFNNAGRDGPANMSLGSILSDAQELMAMGRIDEARQYLNRVKMAIFEAAPITLWQQEH